MLNLIYNNQSRKSFLMFTFNDFYRKSFGQKLSQKFYRASYSKILAFLVFSGESSEVMDRLSQRVLYTRERWSSARVKLAKREETRVSEGWCVWLNYCE